MPFELLVALRFLREGRVQTLLILAGITVGVGVVVFVSALIAALQRDTIQRTLGTQAHIVLREQEDRNVREAWPGVALADVQKRLAREQTIGDWSRKLELARGVEGVTAAAAIASGAGLAGRGGVSKSVNLVGIELPDYLAVLQLDDKVVAGQLLLPSGAVLIGSELALELGLQVSDRVRLSTETAEQSFIVSGIVDFGAKEINRRRVLLPLRSAQSLLGYRLDVTDLYLRVNSLFDATDIAEIAARRTGLQAESWMQLNAQLLGALRAQSSSSGVIRTFVLLSVALAIASVLVVSVVQKSAEIGVMRAYGVRAGSIVWIFLIQGALLGFLGSLGGSGMAVLLVNAFGALASGVGQNIPDTVVDRALMIDTSLVAIVVGTVAALAPALRAARMDPIQAMRYG
jgi:lipoprotein-releasing system permease protein